MSFRDENPELYMPVLSHKWIARTYKLSPELVKRLNAKAGELRIFPSDLVRFLLDKGLDQVDAGELVISTRPAHRHIIVEGE